MMTKCQATKCQHTYIHTNTQLSQFSRHKKSIKCTFLKACSTAWCQIKFLYLFVVVTWVGVRFTCLAATHKNQIVSIYTYVCVHIYMYICNMKNAADLLTLQQITHLLLFMRQRYSHSYQYPHTSISVCIFRRVQCKRQLQQRIGSLYSYYYYYFLYYTVAWQLLQYCRRSMIRL